MGESKTVEESVTQLPTRIDTCAQATEPASSPPPPPRLSAGERIGGRYLVRALLGTGGFGEVYRVTDEIEGHDRALKLHRLGAYHALARESLEGEFGLLASLTHPNVAAVHDFGWVGSEVAYFTQDLVAGVRLDRAQLDTRTPRALHVLAQLCRALDYLHSRGILHRDVKPANLLLDPATDHLTLLDFGIAQALQTDDRKVAGTWGYVAPEAITGGIVDGRADLYAVGVLIFQLASGKRPFTGTMTQILQMQLLEQPPRLSPEHGGRKLTDLVGRLLERDPARRPATAAELLELLADALGGDIAIDTPDTLASYVLSAQCVGRSEEIEVLSTHLLSSESRRPVIVWGDAGTGKSRLLREVRQRVQLAGGSWVGIEVHRGAATALLTELARAVLTPWVIARLDDDDRRELARALPELRRPRERIAPALDPDRARRARREALCRALSIRFGSSQGVVVVEDLHWATEMDREGLSHLVARAGEAGMPCTFLATARPQSSEAVFAHVAPLSIRLTELSTENARALVAGTFGEAGLLDNTEIGHAIAEGPKSALWIQETLRLAVATGAVARVASSWRVTRDLPALPLADTLAHRLSTLDRRAGRLAETMAVTGVPLRALDLAEMTGAGSSFADALHELVRSGVVEDRPDPRGQRVYAMHDRFADVALARLTDARRAALHRRVGRWLARSRGRDWHSLGRAARHFADAGDHARAAMTYEQAAELARRHARPADALRLLDGHTVSLEALGKPATVELLLRRHDLALLAGLPDVASRTLAALRARASGGTPVPSDREQIEIEIRTVRAELRDEREVEARRRCHLAADRARGMGARDLEARLLLTAAESEFTKGSVVTGRELALRAAALAAEVGNHEIEARAWHRCAYTAVHVGLAEQSVKECDLALRAARRSGDLGLQSTIARQKGNVLREINRMAGSMRWYERGVLLARRAGQPELEAMAINNIGILALWMGRFDRAASAFARAIELKRRSGLSASLRVTQSNVVAALVASGDHVRARALLEEVIPAESPDEGPMVICASFANLAETYLAEDDLGRAAELYERAYSLGSERGNLQMAGYPLHGLVRAEVMRGGAFLARAKERIPQLAELAALFKQERTRLHVAEAVIADAEGRIADALASCQRAWELRSSARYQWGFVGSTIEIHWLRAILFARAGREAAARRAAEGARKKLLSMADHIASPERRRRALEVPPIHHAILHGRLDTPLGWAWMPRATS